MTAAAVVRPSPPLVVHIIRRLAVGGLENGLVNLINRMPATAYRHAIVCLTESSDFQQRLQRADVQVIALNRPAAGQDPAMQLALWRLFLQLRPTIVHTRNIATIEAAFAARMAAVPIVVHGEHGWDSDDPDGSNRKRQILRRLCKPMIDEFVALSSYQADYLLNRIGVPEARLTRLCNGVDTERFIPKPDKSRLPKSFQTDDCIVFGTVGRWDPVKDPLNLLNAFFQLHAQAGSAANRLRLVLVGDGELRPQLEALLEASGLASQVWLPGMRDDIPALLNALDVFVLPSQAEGISNSILEAMSSGLPVVATAVGGNPQLVDPGVTGELPLANDSAALANAMQKYLESDIRNQHSQAARQRAEQEFSLTSMVGRYQDLYDRLQQRKRASRSFQRFLGEK